MFDYIEWQFCQLYLIFFYPVSNCVNIMCSYLIYKVFKGKRIIEIIPSIKYMPMYSD